MRNTYQLAGRCFLPVLALLVAGCSGSNGDTPTGDVEGTVNLDKNPLSNGSISFYDPKSGATAGAEIKDGKFKFTDPVKVGTYQVAILPPAETEPPNDPSDMKKQLAANKSIPSGYQTGSTSGFTAEVKEGEANTFNFELSKRGPKGPPGGATPP